ncbi:unnamed protein product [Chrysoparadoxa australica]
MNVPNKKVVIDLLLAARDGDLVLVKEHINRGSNLEERDLLGDTAFLKAARCGHTETVRALIAAGANSNASDAKQWTAIHSCIANNHERLVLELMEVGAGTPRAPNLEARTSTGDTPLHFAAYHKRIEAMKGLLAKGVDPKPVNNNKKRPADVTSNETVLNTLRDAGGCD